MSCPDPSGNAGAEPLAQAGVEASPAVVPDGRARLAASLLAAWWSALLLVVFMRAIGRPTDLDPVLQGARYFFRGIDPYASIGPGRAFEWVSPLYYPGSALLAVGPLALLPTSIARIVFVALSGAVLCWAITRDGWSRLPALVSVPFLHAVWAAQWSPLVGAMFFLAPLGVLWALKPTVGVATLFGARTQRAQVVAVLAGLAVLGVSLVVQPGWPASWRGATRDATHMSFLVAHVKVGGPLILLCLLRWRRPEARWLAALACVPQSTVLYEGLYPILCAQSRLGVLVLTLLSYVLQAWHIHVFGLAQSTAELQHLDGDGLVLLLYLPATLMILRRPNVGESPAWMERLAGAVGGAYRRLRRRRLHDYSA